MGFRITFALLAGVATLMAGTVYAQTPVPSPSPTPPVTTVPQFPSTPHYLRAFPGPEEDSWYVYASGFTPRVGWVLGEVSCASVPCPDFHEVSHDLVKEDGTMTFYAELPRAADPSRPRLLAAVADSAPGLGSPTTVTAAPADAPSVSVTAHNPGTGLGYPPGTRTGIAAVDDVITASQSNAVRDLLVLKDGTTTSGSPIHGVATWQCQPYVVDLTQPYAFLDYPAGLVYAVFVVPNDPALPLRYQGAAYGIAWYDGGTGMPLGGLTLVSATGQIVGFEVRCGTTPGFHVHNFTNFILAPFSGPPTALAPRSPATGNSLAVPVHDQDRDKLAFAVAGLGFALALAAFASRRRRV